MTPHSSSFQKFPLKNQLLFKWVFFICGLYFCFCFLTFIVLSWLCILSVLIMACCSNYFVFGVLPVSVQECLSLLCFFTLGKFFSEPVEDHIYAVDFGTSLSFILVIQGFFFSAPHFLVCSYRPPSLFL